MGLEERANVCLSSPALRNTNTQPMGLGASVRRQGRLLSWDLMPGIEARGGKSP